MPKERKVLLTVYGCKFADGDRCTFPGEGVPSAQRTSRVLGINYCLQPASIDRGDIECSKAEIRETEIKAYVTKEGLLS
jgi:hypothetical protein